MRTKFAMVLLAAAALTTLADSTPGEEPGAVPAPLSKRQIEEIIVTAQKTPQSLDDVPLSINVISGEFLEKAGIFDLKGVEAYVPNVRVELDPTAPTLTLRGLGSYAASLFEPSVGVVVDEVALARPEFILDSIFDVERIEVLRGPQGTLFGKNTPAGVFNIVTGAPTDEPSGTIGGYLGTLGERRLNAAVSGPVTKTLAVRLAGLYTEQSEFVHNTLLDREEEVGTRESGRVKLRWTPTERAEVGVSAARGRQKSTYWAAQNSDLEPASRDYLDDFDPRIEDDPFDFQTSLDFPGSVGGDTSLLTGRAKYDLGDVGPFAGLELTAVAARTTLDGFADWDIDATPADLLPTLADAGYSQDSVEVRLGGRTAGPFGWGESVEVLVGGYFFRSEGDSTIVFVAGEDLPTYLATEDGLESVTGADETTPPGPAVLGQVADAIGLDPGAISGAAIGEDDATLFLDQTNAAEALFGQFTWHATRQLALSAGARVNQDRKRGFFRNTTRGGLAAAFLGVEEFERIEKRSERDVSPRASAQYDWTEELTTFFTWGRGFKGGGFNPVSFIPADNQFGPERSQSFDLGLKATLFDETLRVNFRTTFDDLQIQIFDGTHFLIINAASATSQGVEGDFHWLSPWQPLSMIGSIGWIDARYGEGSVGPAQIFSGSETQALDGQRLVFAPDLTAALSPTLAFPVTPPFVSVPVLLATTLDVLYTGGHYLDIDGDPHVFQPGYVQLNARAGLGDPDGLWSIDLNGKNLADERFSTVTTDSAVLPGSYVGRQSQGRRFGVEAAVRW